MYIQPRAVEMISSSIASNQLKPPVHTSVQQPASQAAVQQSADKVMKGVSCEAHVLDWDKIDIFQQAHQHRKYDLVVGAEVVHEVSHAAGVLRAIRLLMAAGGKAVIVNGAAKHRFGIVEFQEQLKAAQDLVSTCIDVPAPLTHSLESLAEGMLLLQVYTISWASL